MVVHFCPHCGRINLADFLFCPYCGVAVSAGPGLPEAIEEPFARMERLAPWAGPADASAELEELAARLAAIEADIDELLAARKGSN
jgi:hypothetical protein